MSYFVFHPWFLSSHFQGNEFLNHFSFDPLSLPLFVWFSVWNWRKKIMQEFPAKMCHCSSPLHFHFDACIIKIMKHESFVWSQHRHWLKVFGRRLALADRRRRRRRRKFLPFPLSDFPPRASEEFSSLFQFSMSLQIFSYYSNSVESNDSKKCNETKCFGKLFDKWHHLTFLFFSVFCVLLQSTFKPNLHNWIINFKIYWLAESTISHWFEDKKWTLFLVFVVVHKSWTLFRNLNENELQKALFITSIKLTETSLIQCSLQTRLR